MKKAGWQEMQVQEQTDLMSSSLPAEAQYLLSASISPMMMSPSSFTVSLAASRASISSLDQSEISMVCDSQSEISMVCVNQSEISMVCDSQSEMNMVCDSQSEMNMVCDNQSEMNMVCDNQSEMSIVCVNQLEISMVCVNQSETSVSYLFSSSVFMVMNLRSIRLRRAAMTARPNMMKKRAKMTYSG